MPNSDFSVREHLEELKKLCEGCGKIWWCGLTNGNHMLCVTCDDIAYAALPKLIEEIERLEKDVARFEKYADAIMEMERRLGQSSIEVSKALGLPFDACFDLAAALQSGGSNA